MKLWRGRICIGMFCYDVRGEVEVGSNEDMGEVGHAAVHHMRIPASQAPGLLRLFSLLLL